MLPRPHPLAPVRDVSGGGTAGATWPGFVRAAWMVLPPYQEVISAPRPPVLVPEGSVLLFAPGGRGVVSDAQEIAAELRRIRRSYPVAVLGLRVDGATDASGINEVRAWLHHGVRLVISSRPDEAALRSAVGSAGVWPGELADWLRIRLAAGSPKEFGVIDGGVATVTGEWLRPATLEGLGRAFARMGLPEVRRWRMLARVLAPLVRLQGDPELSVGALCADIRRRRQDFARTCRALFGAPPGQLRQRLGWEWRLERFLRR